MTLHRILTCVLLASCWAAPVHGQDPPDEDELQELTVDELLALSRRVEGLLRERLTPAEATEQGIPLRRHDYGPDELQGFDWRELAYLADELAEMIEGRLLAPPPSVERAWDGRLTGPHAGVLRLLPPGTYRGRLQGEHDASGYSFQTRTHSGADGDLQWTGTSLATGHASNSIGWLLDVGDVPLDELVAPEEDGASDALTFLWSPQPGMPSSNNRQALDGWKGRVSKQAGAAGLSSETGIAPDRTCLLRALRIGSHDLLIGLRVERQDDIGLVLAWRRLARFPVAIGATSGSTWRARRTRREIHYPERLQGVSTESLIDLQGDIQEVGRELLLRPDPALEERFADQLATGEYGLVKLLGQGDFARLTGLADGGSRVGFADLSREKRRSDLFLSVPDGSVRGTEYLQVVTDQGGGGYLFDLGAFPLERLEGQPTPPAEFTRQERSNWTQAMRSASLSSAARRTVRVAAKSGHTYVLRFQVENGRDHLVALRVVATDETGVTLLFKRLKTFREASG